jgi:hypothetical protein
MRVCRMFLAPLGIIDLVASQVHPQHRIHSNFTKQKHSLEIRLLSRINIQTRDCSIRF